MRRIPAHVRTRKRRQSASASGPPLDDWSVSHLMRSLRTISGERVSETKAMNYSAVWAATRVLCGTGGSLPLHLYRRVNLESRGLRGEGKERVRGSELGRALEWRPNPEMDALRFRRLMWHYMVNWGNADAEVVRNDDGEVVELWPLHPLTVKCERNNANQLRWEVTDDNGGKRYLSADRIFHVANIISHDGVSGLGTIEAARESVGFGLATERYGANYFGKGGIPRLVIEFPGLMNDQLRKAFREEWQTIYGGSGGDRVAVLQNGAKASPLDIPPEDSQFLETRQYNIEEIARWYGIPPHLLQRMVQVTYSNAEILPLDFVKFTLLQYLEAWEAAINTQLIRPEDSHELFAKHNVNGLMRGDSASRSTYLKGMVASALMTRNEARAYEDLEPVEGGDTFLVQGATVPLDDEGRPESEFVNGPVAAESAPSEDAAADPEEKTPAVAKIAANAKVALAADLQRMATKEGKRAIEESSKPATFTDRIDTFYAQHATIVTAAVDPYLSILSECGATVDTPSFVASWIGDGKEAMLQAAGTATYQNLEPTVRSVVESREWTDRAIRAIAGIEVQS